VSEILQAAPNVKVLATSREKLNLQGETIFPLAGMDFPDWETPEDALRYAAVKLFMQSAKRVQPGLRFSLRF
jgi:predicted ATPase